MRLFRFILMAALVWFAPLGLRAAEAAAEPHLSTAHGEVEKAHAEGAEHKEGLPLYATPIFHIGPLAVTNSMIVTWTVALLLILGAQMATRNIKDVPEGAQNF